MDGSRIPQELKLLNRWVSWRYVKRNGKRTKVPLNPRTDYPASCNDPTTWGTYEETLQRLMRGEADGIGFQLGPPYVGIDLDECRNAEIGSIDPWAENIIRVARSYTEASPGGRGVHTLVKGSLPHGPRRKGRVEMYDGNRYFTVTGKHLDGTPSTIEERTQELKIIHGQIFGKDRAKTEPTNVRKVNDSPTDAELIELARQAENGAKFGRLWKGDRTGYNSPSEADLALCAILVFWTGRDAARVDRLFRQSGLYRPKWDERHGADGRCYGQITIDKAIEQTTEVWAPRGDCRRANPDAHKGTSLPLILVNGRQLRDVTADSLRALVDANIPPQLYVRAGSLVRTRKDEKGRPIIENVGDDELRGRLSRVADYFRKNGCRSVPCAPPLDVVRDILGLGQWSLPPLESIIEVPILRPDGTVVSEPGYDQATHLLYIPAVDLHVPQIPISPSEDDVANAREQIDEAVGEFPYEDEVSKANAIALVFTPVVRQAITGQVPLAIVDAPQSGSGKTLYSSVVSIIATGRDAEMLSAPRDEEEWRKRLLALLYEGATIITIDNVDRTLESMNLASVLTSSVWKDRILGLSKTLAVSQRATWIANGNNIRLGGDLPRRCYWIRLNAKDSRPWQRTGFKHPDLIAWVFDNRGKLLAALLTIARAWYAAGKPTADVPVIGSFESWARTIGGILDHGGFLDPGTGRLAFLGNLQQMYELIDESSGQWEGFLLALQDSYGKQEFTVKDLCKRLEHDQAVQVALPDELEDREEPGSFSRRLGWAFSKRAGTRYGDSGIHIERAGEEKRATKWRVVIG